MNSETTLYFRDQLREARAIALRDAEAFHEIIFVLERLGSYLCIEPSSKRQSKKMPVGLKNKEDDIVEFAGRSPLADKIPSRFSELHTSFATLFRVVRTASRRSCRSSPDSSCHRIIDYFGGRSDARL
jgi:hypothetical protein